MRCEVKVERHNGSENNRLFARPKFKIRNEAVTLIWNITGGTNYFYIFNNNDFYGLRKEECSHKSYVFA